MKLHTNRLFLFTSNKALCGIGVLLLGGVNPAAAQSTVFIDFGNDARQMASPNTGTYWNNLNQLQASVVYEAANGGSISLVNSLNTSTGITLTVTDLFENENNAGTSTPSTSVSEFNFNNMGFDSLHTQNTNPTAGFTFSGLNSGFTYKFTMFAARIGVSDVRSAAYTFTGGSTQTVTLDASNNTSNTVVTTAIVPDGSNNIIFSMAKAASNDNPFGFAYLGGMKIEIAVIPEPSSFAALAGLSVLGLVAYRRRRA